MWTCIACDTENPMEAEYCQECEAPREMESLKGLQISHWTLEEELGEGGMAVVYRARHVRLGSPVAIKLLKSEITQKREVIERFRTEALAASHLRHNNVIQVLDFGFQKGVGFYMVLEYLEGVDLEFKINEAPFPTYWIKEFIRQFGSALEAAHDAGILHRDLKPSNVFLVPRAESEVPLVKVLDFGIAKIQETTISELEESQQKLTQTGTILGTPFYLAPEQLRRRPGTQLGPSVDIYAFGVMLFQLFTGQLPIEEDSMAEQMVAILTRPVPLAGEVREELSGTALEIYLHRLLAKNPDDRPSSIKEAMEEFERAVEALDDGDMNQALRQKWESDYQEILKDTKPPTFLEKWRTVIVFLVLLVSGISAGAYFLRGKNTTKIIRIKADAGPAKPMKMPELPSLMAEGTKAFKAKNYLKAIKLWKKVTSSKNWEKGKFFNPKLYKSLGVAMARRQWLNAAIIQYKKYVRNGKLSADQQQTLQQVIKGLSFQLQKRLASALKTQAAISKLLKKKQHKEAKSAYNYLLSLDRSHPDTYLAAAKAVGKLYPFLAMKLYKNVKNLDLSEDKKKKILAAEKDLTTKTLTKRKQLTEKLVVAVESKKKRNIRRALRALLNGLPDDASVHQFVLSLAKKYLSSEPKTTKHLLKQYKKEVTRLKRRKDWKFWLKDRIEKKVISDKKVDTLVQATDDAKKVAKADKKAKRLFKSGNLTAALGAFKKSEEKWKALAENKESPLQKKAAQELTNAQNRITQLTKAVELEKQIKTFFEKGQPGKAKPLIEEYKTLMKENRSTGKMNRTLVGEMRKYRKAIKAYRKARKLYRKEKWYPSERAFIDYMRVYPKSYMKKYVEKQIFLCKCNRGVPWKECPKRRKK